MKSKKKIIAIVVAIIVIALICLGVYFVKETFFSKDVKAIYGNRLDGIEKVKITEEKKNAIRDRIAEDASSTTVRVQGRIINIKIIVNDDKDLNAAKAISAATLETLTDEEKAYYDIQFLVNKNTETNQFPIIGYKHHTKGEITWTKDRAEN